MIKPASKPLLIGDKTTVEFECQHRFCAECVIQQFQEKINNAEVDDIKCLEYGCDAPVSDNKLQEILQLHDQDDLYDKKV